MASSFLQMSTAEPAILAAAYRLGRDAEGRFTLHDDDGLLIRGERGSVLQMLTSHCLGQFVARCRDGLMFHAAAVARGDRALLLPAESGAGKTTLSAWLCRRDFALLSDEAIFLSKEAGVLEPFRRLLDVKESGRQAIGGWINLDGDPRILRTPDGFLIPPSLVDGTGPARPARLAAIVFSRYQQGASLEFEPVSPARAALWLMSSLVNARNLPNHGFDAVTRLARTSPAYSLRYGNFEQIRGRFDGVLLRVP